MLDKQSRLRLTQRVNTKTPMPHREILSGLRAQTARASHTPPFSQHRLFPAPEMDFLHLPTDTRRRIYLQADLPINSRVHFSETERAKLVSRARRQNIHKLFRRADLKTYCSLRLVCRKVTVEVLDIFFSTNRFYATSYDLSALCHCPATALASMQHLCLTLDARAGQDLEWSRAAATLGPHISPDCLQLSLACDAPDDESMADLVVDALLRYLPRLRSCELRLGSSGNGSSRYEGSLGRKARKAALQATGQWPEPQRTFHSFMLLQTELRLKILEYTDLVTPLNRITWNKREGYALEKPRCFVPNNGPPYNEPCHPEAHLTCSESNNCNKCPHLFPSPVHARAVPGCSRCTHWVCQFLDCRGKVEQWPVISPSFCSRHYAAYTPNCTCWMPPTALFLVNGAFTDHARHIFFSQNTFNIRDPDVFFTRFVPESAMPSLQRVEVQLHYDDDDDDHNGGIIFRRWRETVARLLWQKLLVPQSVQLDLTFEDDLPSWPRCTPWDNIRETLPIFREQRGTQIVRETVDMVWPIETSSYLRRIKAHIAVAPGAGANFSYWLHDKTHPFPSYDHFVAEDFARGDEAFYQHDVWRRAQTEDKQADDQLLLVGTEREWTEGTAIFLC